jgi:hypothetical protein
MEKSQMPDNGITPFFEQIHFKMECHSDSKYITEKNPQQLFSVGLSFIINAFAKSYIMDAPDTNDNSKPVSYHDEKNG